MFKDAGFLNPIAGPALQRALSDHAPELALAQRLNVLTMRELWNLEIPTSEKHLAMGAMLYVRAVRSYQAALLMLCRGLCVESMAAMRVIMECVILTAKLRIDPSYGQVLEAEQERHRITQATKMIGFRDRLSAEVAAKIEKIAMQPPPDRGQSLESIAKEVGMDVLYHSMYRGASGYAAHATVGALDRSLKLVDGLPEMTFSEDSHLVDEALSHLIPLGIDAVSQMAALFRIPSLTSELVSTSIEWQALAGRDRA